METWLAKSLNSPNDVVVKSDGSIWFTDPIFGILGNYEGHKAESEVPQAVYRVDGETGEPTVIADDVWGRTVYVSRRTNRSCMWSNRGVSRIAKSSHYDVGDDGKSISNKRIHIDAGPGGTPDGMRSDIDGNLWCGWGMGEEGLDGVLVVAPDGERIGFIHLPERCANVCFGGVKRNRLFMAASQSLYSVYVNTQGVAGG